MVAGSEESGIELEHWTHRGAASPSWWTIP